MARICAGGRWVCGEKGVDAIGIAASFLGKQGSTMKFVSTRLMQCEQCRTRELAGCGAVGGGADAWAAFGKIDQCRVYTIQTGAGHQADHACGGLHAGEDLMRTSWKSRERR